MITLIPLSVEHDKPIPDLVEKIMSRISTIQGVKDGGVKLSRDCRTCIFYAFAFGASECVNMRTCTNHDQWVEAEFVQLTGNGK
jgi:hypothetical protein